MPNRFIAFCLLFAMFSASFSRFFVYASFEMNKKYIAAKLCENKNRPWLHCDGHCYFMKKVKQAEEKERKQAREDQKNRYVETLPNASFTLVFSGFDFKIVYPESLTPGTVQQAFPIFQPPKIAAKLNA